jgi:pimeloyl-ACP methyl ester carboxylesterase
MKLILVALALLFCLGSAFGQDITGDWHGMLDLEGFRLRIVFHITTAGDSLSATFDSPDQGAFGLPVNKVSFENPVLTMETTSPPIRYTGELKDGNIIGTFEQAGFEAPLDMKREAMEKPVYNRPQDPKEPFPYKVEEIEFLNASAGIKLAGTLTLPESKGPHTTMILISGSGGQDRNEELLGHKPFWVIADHLTRKGIAVLRFDDRGIGASEGDHSLANSLDFASDVKSAILYLKSRSDIGKIGLIGHSEGGIIAPMVASETPEVELIVLLAGPGIRGDELLLLQEESIWRAEETDEETIEESLYVNRNIFAMIIEESDTGKLSARISEFLVKSVADSLVKIPEGYSAEEVITQAIAETTSPWMLYFIRHDPAPVLETVRCPVLALIGSKDLQVPPKENLEAIGNALQKAGNRKYTLMELEGLNHLFQECETGHPSEYARIEQTFAPSALDVITKWIIENTIR